MGKIKKLQNILLIFINNLNKTFYLSNMYKINNYIINLSKMLVKYIKQRFITILQLKIIKNINFN